MVTSVTSIVVLYYYAYGLKTFGKYVEILLIRSTQHYYNIIITLLHNIYYI